jgi:DNA-binding PadR family transcriptional regulator
MISKEFIKGSVRTIILKILKEDGPMHGYALTKRVEELTQGNLKLTYGNLYPLLHKLENEKALVTTRDISSGRMRIIYALTPKGETLVVQKIREIREFIETLQIIVDLKPGLKYV